MALFKTIPGRTATPSKSKKKPINEPIKKVTTNTIKKTTPIKKTPAPKKTTPKKKQDSLLDSLSPARTEEITIFPESPSAFPPSPSPAPKLEQNIAITREQELNFRHNWCNHLTSTISQAKIVHASLIRTYRTKSPNDIWIYKHLLIELHAALLLSISPIPIDDCTTTLPAPRSISFRERVNYLVLFRSILEQLRLVASMGAKTEIAHDVYNTEYSSEAVTAMCRIVWFVVAVHGVDQFLDPGWTSTDSDGYESDEEDDSSHSEEESSGGEDEMEYERDVDAKGEGEEVKEDL